MSTARTTNQLKRHHYALRSLGPVEETAEETAEETKPKKAKTEIYSRQLYDFMKKMGDTPFTAKDEETVSDLIQKGASVNYGKPDDTCYEGRYTSPYIMALENGNANVITLCLKAGADISEVISVPHGSRCTFPLAIAAEHNHIAAAKVLIEHKANLEQGQAYNGLEKTALLVAAEEIRAEMVKLLLDAGANPKARSCWGGNALNYAVEGYERISGEMEDEIDSETEMAKLKKDFNTILDYLVPLLKNEPVIADRDPEYKKITDTIHKIIDAESDKNDEKPVMKFGAR